MLTVTLLLYGAVLIALTLSERTLRQWPLNASVIYLVIGWCAGAALGAPSAERITGHAGALVVATELAVLVSLVAVGLRLGMPASASQWHAAWLLAGPGMVATVALGTLVAGWLLGLPWPAALLLAAVLAPTDPVLASEVQIRSDDDRDAVRLSLTAEGGLNDGSALPAVMLALAWMGLYDAGIAGWRWWTVDLLWAIGGGAAIGIATGRLLGVALRRRIERGDRLARDELLFVGVVLLAYGLARATHTSTFVVAFAVGVTLLWPFHTAAMAQGGQALSQRLHAFGARIERLVEAATVLAVGVALNGVELDAATLVFALLLVIVVRPLAVIVVLARRRSMPRRQRRLVAWFGIRGIGALFYLAFALEHGVVGSLAEEMIAATLVAVALSIVLHGVSATPLMAAYHRRRESSAAPPPTPPSAPPTAPPADTDR